MTSNLSTILELPDVQGLFCLKREGGTLLYNHLPKPFLDDIFETLGSRILMLLDAVNDNYKPTGEYLLNFYGSSLFIKANDQHVLGVLCGENPNLQGLRIASNMGLKQIAAEPVEFAKTSPRERAHPAPEEERATIGWGEETAPRKQKASRKKERSSSFDDIWS